MKTSEHAQADTNMQTAKEAVFRALAVFWFCPEGKKLPQAKPRKL